MSEPRREWILSADKSGFLTIKPLRDNLDHFEEINVIDRRDYDALQAKLDQAVKALEKLAKHECNSACYEIGPNHYTLKSELIARDTLKLIQGDGA